MDWSNGKPIELKNGDTARATGLNNKQIYGIFFYNHAQADNTATVNVTFANDKPPAKVEVPGTTSERGLASIAFIWGGDWGEVAASIVNQPNAKVMAFICSVSLPKEGVNNKELKAGTEEKFSKLARFWAVLPSSWHNVTLKSGKTQFMVARFKEQSASVLIVNPVQDPETNIYWLGGAKGKGKVIIPTQPPKNEVSEDLQGNGRQIVWMNADSVQNSQDAWIKLQALTRRQGADGETDLGAGQPEETGARAY